MNTPGRLAFATLCKETFGGCTFQEALVKACAGQSDIAWAAFHHLGDDSMAWLYRQVPALDGARPADLIASGHADRVRHCLLGFPY